MKHVNRAVALSFTCMLWVACSDTAAGTKKDGEVCDKTEECEAYLICNEGSCTPLCNGDDDCGRGRFCSDGLCVRSECGNGHREGEEQCDAGQQNADSSACTTECKLNVCGDGNLYAGVEECDEGPRNSDTRPNACRTNCKPAHCGDGVVDSAEACGEPALGPCSAGDVCHLCACVVCSTAPSAEVCDGEDDDCNGTIDDAVQNATDCVDFFLDADNDGFGITTDSQCWCLPTGDYRAFQDGDCNDVDALIHPGATEGVADGVDQDCNGEELCYLDGDDDGYRPDETSMVSSANLSCTDSGEAESSDATGDCADNDPNRHPGAPEVCNNLDDDCDTFVDGTPPVANCQCADGGSPLPAENCTNDVDDDCNGQVNDGCAMIRPSNLGNINLCQNTEALNLIATNAMLVTDYGGSLDILDSGDMVTETIQQSGGMPDITVFYFHSITIDSASLLRISGTPALALVSCTNIVIEGTVDACASGQQGGAGGYGGGDINAEGVGLGKGGSGTGSDPYSNFSGGGGGGYCGMGGGGGSAGVGGSGFAAGGAGGSKFENPDIVPLVGGSGGGGGAESQNGTKVGGGGGGAVQLMAKGSIAISGVITACGGGGGGPTADGDAGGGGGSGGAILIEASIVTLESTAVIAANGGGGGGGDDYGTPVADTTGEDGPAEARRAAGGEHGEGDNPGSGSDAGDGGAGGALASADMNGGGGGSDTKDSYPGGGGGGGSGYIRINTAGAVNLVIDPSAVLSPSGSECYSRGNVAYQ